MWTPSVLQHVSYRIFCSFDQNGKGTESFFESYKDFRSMWKADVLSDK